MHDLRALVTSSRVASVNFRASDGTGAVRRAIEPYLVVTASKWTVYPNETLSTFLDEQNIYYSELKCSF
jgi:hypothetical protein